MATDRDEEPIELHERPGNACGGDDRAATRVRALVAFGSCLLALVAVPSGCGGASGPAADSPGGGTSTEAAPAAPQPLPDIVFILIDTLRADALGSWGNPREISPALDTIADEGVVFERCMSVAPWTLPSIATLFTGYYPAVHKTTNYTQAARMNRGLRAKMSMLGDETFTTMAEILQAAGYTTAGFVANKLVLAEYGFAQGFDHFDAGFAGNSPPGNLLNEAAFEWLATYDASKPLFLYLHYMDVHGPYLSGPEFTNPLVEAVEALPEKHRMSPRQLAQMSGFIRKPNRHIDDQQRYQRLENCYEYWRARYEAGVAQADFHIDRMIARLEQLGIWKDAFVIVTSDHGEALGEHDLWDHGFSLHQTDIHVPLILRRPGVLPVGRRVTTMVSLIDVLPTLLAPLGLPGPDNVQGRSLLTLLDTPPSEPPVAYFDSVKTMRPAHEAVIRGEWKLIRIERPDAVSPQPAYRYQLYHLPTDPTELHSRADEQPQRVAALNALIDQHKKRNAMLKPGHVAELAPVDDAAVRRLEALGYVAGAAEEPDQDEAPDDD